MDAQEYISTSNNKWHLFASLPGKSIIDCIRRFFYSAICIVRILGLLAQLKFKMQEHLHAMAIYVMRLKIDTAML